MNITFTELSETVWMMEYMIHFAEKRDNQFGGATGRNAELNGESASFYFEYLNTRYPVEKFIFQSTA